ncbi:MAG: cytochrome C [Methylococcaceae bacterium]|nr:cytochrome C [Methylococcaceae bacterium]
MRTSLWAIPAVTQLLLCFSVLIQVPQALAAKPLAIKSARYDARHRLLKVKTATRSLSGTVSLLHGAGGLLDQRPLDGNNQSFSIPLARLGQVPCSVEVRAGGATAVKAVAGAPQECRKTPVCKISKPANGAQLAVNTPFEYAASVKVRDRKAGELSYEWDFGGGVMGNSSGEGLANATLRPSGLSGTTSFVRGDAVYRVRFAALDGNKRYCEAAVEVTVGAPPADLPAKVAEQASPVRGGEIGGEKNDLVVLPFQEWTMQHTSDMRQQPIGYDSFNHLFNNMEAYVVRKGSVGLTDKPKLLGPDDVELRYSAASNPFDPVGADSINSTSQNWPLKGDGSQPAPFMDAATTVKKTDNWELHPDRPAETVDPNYRNWSQVQSIFAWAGLHNASPNLPAPDEGYYPHGTPPLEGEQEPDYFQWYQDQYAKFQKLKRPDADHGSYMPGKAAPFVANDPQPFYDFDADNKWFRAAAIPVTDVADRGRVNPYSLMRVEAVDEGGQAVAAATDGVLNTSRDFHCRECHAKGRIAANSAAGYKAEAFLSSPKGQDPWYFDKRDPNRHLDKPEFYEATGDTLYDQEYAASLNYASLHDFYDGYDFVGSMINGGGSLWSFHNGLAKEDTPKTCNGCHYTPVEAMFRKETFWIAAPYDNTNLYYNPDYSMAMHRFHGEMQYNDEKTDILRNGKGAYARFDWKSLSKREPGKNPNPRTLFPVFGADGQQLPMEENCLKCHAGHREPLYNDRMATAGVTCYDCHGDMLAMGRAFPKDAAKAGSTSNNDYRIAWFDQTDCGSCHSGKGSDAVLKRAFDDSDLSATSRPVDLTDPDTARFAVVPKYRQELEAYTYWWDAAANGGEGADGEDTSPLKVDSPLYRFGKDQHANMACAACHGVAHSIGPNRDPKANDNITALQLQGYAGPVLECSVCHTRDAFAAEESIGSTLHYPDKVGKATILAGPHNLHPVNDPNWYLNERSGDTAQANQTDGTRKGGWHSAWSGKPGLKGEDQCAACHGTDHRGTRLSKTPVDRVFDFSGFDRKKLRTAGFKSRVIRVKAGTPIGCDTCHDVETSRLLGAGN